MKSLLCSALAVAVLLSSPVAWAKTYVIAVNQFVEHPALNAVLKGFQDYLKEKGLDCEYKVHNAKADMASAGKIAQTIASENPDLVLAIATPSAQAQAQVIKQAPKLAKVPLLFAAVTAPVSANLVSNLQRPGGNITGISDLVPVDKHLGMIREFLPKLKRIGVVYNASESNSKTLVQILRFAANKEDLVVEEATAATPGNVDAAARSLVGRCDAVYMPTDNTVAASLDSVVKVCEQNKLPLFAADVDSVPRGCVAALGLDYTLHGRQAGAMAERLLKGAAPGVMPVESQEDLKLEINLKAALAMGVTVPEATLKKASMVIK